MAELANCARCDAVFVKTIRDICPDCYKEEERAFEVVYQFLRQRKNREATLPEIVDATGVEEELIIKFVKEKRLRTTEFPKLAYPCETCGADIATGRLCEECSNELKDQLAYHERIEQFEKDKAKKEKERVHAYYTLDRHK
ncbi:TIGR03826 family flagellar region protein [Lentibacillus saliphilus]|uniref:TIGR03826 family flagellar region protein n=1 Tax=Lentibacillus saliphilus TaxID=2737028 RepID=UPI001C303129|nr:TIGR03826 family flagellar region protein [Lentibacillus saliphilus]